MILPHVLYIASNSASRKKMLEDSGIPFQVIEQDANESLVDATQPIVTVVTQIAQLKMLHAKVPAGKQEDDVCFVLTADTLGLTAAGRVLCKPVDRKDAVSMLQESRQGTLTVTAFVLRKMQWQVNSWVVVEEVIDYDQVTSIFNVPQAFLDFYLDTIPFLSVSGAISIEGFGGQFLQSIHGSYESVVGLPMFKIREALYAMNFYQ